VISQYYISVFNEYLHKAKAEIIVLEHIKEEEGVDNDHFKDDMVKLHYDLHHASIDLFDALLISSINLMFPVDWLIQLYFIKKTNR
jgi:hypothetical protein